MTALRNPVRRETAAMIRERGKLLPVVVELHPGYMILRQKGRRHRYSIDYTEVYRRAAEIMADAERRERAQARAAKRKARA